MIDHGFALGPMIERIIALQRTRFDLTPHSIELRDSHVWCNSETSPVLRQRDVISIGMGSPGFVD